ncbi:MAG: AsmA-like C-terminal region-containing protein, partial [Pseudolabrys sp.]
LSVEDGRIVLGDAASGAGVTLDKVWFNGDVRSLLGPLKGEGAFKIGSDLYPYRISAGRFTTERTLKLHVNVDPVNHPLSIETDGTLSLSGDTPGFDGTLKLARPVGIAQQSAGAVTQPWRVGGKIKVTAASALMEQVEFVYGSEEQGIKLTGTADFKFGAHPHFQGVLSGRQIDLDRVLENSDATHPPPAAAFRKLAEMASGAFRPTFPIDLGIGIDQVTLGGNTIQTVRGDVSTDANGWNLDRFEFRAPGYTQVRLSGRLAVGAAGVTFTGPAAIDAGDPRKLAAWFAGQPEPSQSQPRPLRLRGEMTLGSEKIAVERLQASFDREAISGRLAYTFAVGTQPSRLDAALTAPELDIDAALGFTKALFAGSSIERPHDMTIALDIGHATFGGIEASKASAQFRIDGNGLAVDKLSVADLGGAAFSASGRIDTGTGPPRGALTLDLEARQTSALAALATKVAPEVAGLTRVFDRVGQTKLHGSLDVSTTNDVTTAKLDVMGDLNAMHVDTKALVSGRWSDPWAAGVRVNATIDAPQSEPLLKLAGLDWLPAENNGPGQIKVLIDGPANGDLTLDVKLSTGDFSALALSHGRFSMAQGATGTGSLQVSPVRQTAQSAGAAPLMLSAQYRIAGRSIDFTKFDASLCGSTLRGRLKVDATSTLQINGDIDGDRFNAGPLLACVFDLPAAKADGAEIALWPAKPFGRFISATGKVTLKAARAALGPTMTARQIKAAVRFGGDEIAIDDLSGDLAGGHFTGQVSFQKAGEGLSTHVRLALKDADVTGLLPFATRPPLTGRLGVEVEVDGAGLTPIAVIGSLRGSGTLTLNDAQIAGLDPHAFDIVARAVDKGLPINNDKIADTVNQALKTGQLSLPKIGGDLIVSAGQIRLTHVDAHGDKADMSMAGSLDLTDGTIDARLVMSGTAETVANARPDIFMALKGPVLSPSCTIDVSALTGWLTLRAVERQSRQLEAIEQAKRREAIEQARQPAVEPKPPTLSNAPPAVAEKKSVHVPTAPKRHVAPPLPPPVVISPMPPVSPEASVGPQN